MSDWLALYELQWLKPALTALLLAPVPMLLLTAIAARRLGRHPASSRLLLVVSICGLWLSATTGAASALADATGLAPQAISAERVASIAQASARPGSAIVVLGGGREPWAPEYAAANLSDESLQRLRYGVWLARQTNLPVAFSGGIGWAAAHGAADVAGDTEADIAARVAAAEFAYPLRWVENRSRDTRENARLTIALLRADRIDNVLLVTHGWHMRRALRAFSAEGGDAVRVEPAPIALSASDQGPILRWMPSGDGFERFRQVSREALGLLLGG